MNTYCAKAPCAANRVWELVNRLQGWGLFFYLSETGNGLMKRTTNLH